MNRFCALLLVLSPALSAFSLAAPASALVPTEQVGSAKFVFEADDALEQVHGQLVISAGSSYEPDDKKGLATLMARLLVRDELRTWLEGAGGSIEASTDLDAIRLAFTCGADELEELLTRLNKACQTPDYETARVASVRTKILRELENDRRSAEGMADIAVERLLFGRFGTYTTVPSSESVEALTAADLRDFHLAHVGANRLICAIVGPLSKENAQTAFSNSLAGLKDTGDAPVDPQRPLFAPHRTFIYVVDAPDADHTEFRFASPGVSRQHDTHPALNSWGWAVAGGEESRMYKELVGAGLATDASCGFDADWKRMGGFRGSMTSPNEKAGDALEVYMNILQDHRAGKLSRAQVEEGRARYTEWEDAQLADPAVRAHRLAQVAHHDFPENYYESLGTYTKTLNGNYLLSALRRNLMVRRLIVVAVGPADQITESLQYYTDTVPYTLETPATDADAQAQVDRLLNAMGGAKLWADLKGVEIVAETEVEQREEIRTRSTHMWRYLDSVHFRSEQENLSEFLSVVDGTPGWVNSELGVRSISNIKYRKQTLNTRRWFYSLLHQLALGNAPIVTSIGEEGRLVFSDSLGEICWLTLGENGRPERMGYVDSIGEQNQIFKSWSKSGDYLYCNEFVIPYAYYETEADFPQRVTKFVPNPPFDPKQFERPSSDS